MTSISAIIIDDEEQNRNVLKILLDEYCQQIKIVAEASNADDAYRLIKNKQPQLIFLDVKMPLKSGFDLLKMFESIDFEVIFISAFQEFAIAAFDYNALAYILKPIDHNKLILAVNKAYTKVIAKEHNENVIQFIQTLDPESDQITKLVIHQNKQVVLVNIKDVLLIETDDNLCTLKLFNNTSYHSSKNLKLFEDILREHENFIRINKNSIINLNFLKSYEKGEICLLHMMNGVDYEVSRRKKTEVLNRIIALR